MVLCLLLIVGGAMLIAKTPPRIAAMGEQRKYDGEFYEYAQLFSEIYSEIRARYVSDVTSDKLFEASINGLFAALDPHSSWLPPDDQESLERDTEGQYSGVGIHITVDKESVLTVIMPIPGGPAAKVGIKAWDRIVEIEGKPTKGMSSQDAVKVLTGPDATPVKIRVRRPGQSELLPFTLVRAKIKIDSVFSKVIDNQIGYMRVSKFQEDTAEASRKALEEFNRQKVRAIIVDLRNDPGGLLDAAVGMCDLFLPKGQVIVSLKGRTSGSDREYKARGGQIAKQPLAVLVNKGSASASEIFAGAMKDTKRGVIVGPKGVTTFGKGSVQTITPLKYSLEKDKNGDYRTSALRLTTAKYYTPSGISIDVTGIAPDLGVEVSRANQVIVQLHGLLGDPDLREPGMPLPDIPGLGDDAASTATLSMPPAVHDGVTTSVLERESANFHDVLLDAAVKYLEERILAEARQAA